MSPMTGDMTKNPKIIVPRTAQPLVRDNMITVQYECQQCHATDTARFFPHESVLPAINCWKCHAGMTTPDIRQQIANHVGMFPVMPDTKKLPIQ